MGKHASKPYNPNIAHVFYLAGFIESWGRGVEKICNALKTENLPIPEYTVHPGDIIHNLNSPDRRIGSLRTRIGSQARRLKR
jgi:ATP-dependent DNA helicase RecG